ncbi:hypothetical protein X777_01850 [Ooceraea biroi]|uniref:Uncharacterized protein n=1 Tax=Ooceraea biroi TaxID=2015173 RepID=A0A026X3E5_OOCBI|nr:hypothetical protein X777_01850 [Ooceraea biroi]
MTHFFSIIHSNPSLSNIHKLQYLRAAIVDDAAKVISSLEISDANYGVVWRFLKERYDNKRVIVQTHLRAIVELPVMSKENASDLRQIADGAARHVHALKALKRPTDSWDDLLVYILSSKLDPATVREWQSSLTGSDLPTLKQFFDCLTYRYQVIDSTSKAFASIA